MAAAQSGLRALVLRGFPPPVDATVRWATVTPDPGTVALQVFVYADAGALGSTTSVVEYRGLRVRSAAPLASMANTGTAM